VPRAWLRHGGVFRWLGLGGAVVPVLMPDFGRGPVPGQITLLSAAPPPSAVLCSTAPRAE